jgi:hypothetical protein
MAPDSKTPEPPPPARPRRQNLRLEMLGGGTPEARPGITPAAGGALTEFELSYNVGEPLRGSVTVGQPGPAPGVAFDIAQDLLASHVSLRVVETGTIYPFDGASNPDSPFPITWRSVLVPSGITTITFETTSSSAFAGPPRGDPTTVRFVVVMNGQQLFRQLSVPAAAIGPPLT